MAHRVGWLAVIILCLGLLGWWVNRSSDYGNTGSPQAPVENPIRETHRKPESPSDTEGAGLESAAVEPELPEYVRQPKIPDDPGEIPNRRSGETLTPALEERAAALKETASKQLDRVGAPRATPRDDLAAINAIFENYLLLVKPERGLPTGLHEEIIVTLRGNNPWGLPFLPDEHPRYDAQNRLTDRWDTPLFFHAESSTELAIRSAGPDRQMYTGDDVIYP
ncbi:MAG: hypothetical protein ACFB21_04155 [Opitutales bacterium]